MASLDDSKDYFYKDRIDGALDRLDVIAEQLTRIADALEAKARAELRDATITFDAGELIPELMDGKRYYRIKGGHYKKFGVRVWPEVLEEAGLDHLLERLEASRLAGLTAVCSVDESGNPNKVIRLEEIDNPEPKAGGPPILIAEPVEVTTSSDSLEPKDANDYTTYYTVTAPALKVDKNRAVEVLNDCKWDAVAAYKALLRDGL